MMVIQILVLGHTMGCLKYSVMNDFFQGGQVATVEVLLVPEVDLVELLHVQGLVSEGGHMQVAPGEEHLVYQTKICTSL